MDEQLKTEKSDNRQELLLLLQNFSNLRTGQDQVLWSVIGSFWTANSLLLVSIFATERQDRLYVGVIISLVGISISWIWDRIQKVSLNRIESYEKSIKRIEKELGLGFDLCSFLKEDSDEYEKTVNKKSARFVMKKFSKYSIYIWMISTIIFAGLLVFENYCK